MPFFGGKFWERIFGPSRRAREPSAVTPAARPKPTVEPTTLGPQSMRPEPMTAAELMGWNATEEAVFSDEWLPMVSSNVAAMKYDLTDLVLYVEFKGGAVYRYENVPPHIALEFWATDSPGRFVWNHLRDKFPYERLAAPSRPRERPTVLRVLQPGIQTRISKGREEERSTIERWRSRWLKQGNKMASQPIYTTKMPGSV